MKLYTFVIECAKGYKKFTSQEEVWEDNACPTWHTIAEKTIIDALDKAAFALIVANQINNEFRVVYLSKTSGVPHSWVIEYDNSTLSLSEARMIY